MKAKKTAKRKTTRISRPQVYRMKCPKCGGSSRMVMLGTGLKCPRCGTIMVLNTLTGKYKCPRCGYEMPAAD